MHVSNYLTRNFATLGLSELEPPLSSASVLSFAAFRTLTHSLNVLASSTRQSLYVDYKSWQRLVFLVNSRPGLFTAAPNKFGALLLPKLRSDFAEFLNEGSLERLRILSPPTCVSFSTDTIIARKRGFS